MILEETDSAYLVHQAKADYDSKVNGSFFTGCAPTPNIIPAIRKTCSPLSARYGTALAAGF
jgi:hypothetical protein